MSLLIGDAFSAGPIASILSPFVLGMLVDRFFASQKVMAVMHLAGAVILWFVPQALVAQNGALLIGLLFGYTLCYMPTLALTNNIAFHSLANVDKTFPVVRVFGTIGWIIAGIFIGVTGISDTTGIFTLAALCSAALAVYSLTLPHTPAPAKGTPVQFRDLLCADAFALLKTRHFLIFSLCATLISIPPGDLLRLYRLLSGGCRHRGRQHRDVVRSDVRNFLYAGDPAAVPPPRGEIHAADRHGGVVRALRLLCAGGQRRGALPALSRHPAARRVL
ncbi:Nucleoside permease NupG [Klebsiella michiganensis]|nr:Nucleoside permease NupG [Klebsiella michiganensis]